VIPPNKNAAFVWRMEAVLDLYEEPYDEKRPVVSFDERPCQLHAEVREPLCPSLRVCLSGATTTTSAGAWPTFSWPSSPSPAGARRP
jgi:hypothetical protein